MNKKYSQFKYHSYHDGQLNYEENGGNWIQRSGNLLKKVTIQINKEIHNYKIRQCSDVHTNYNTTTAHKRSVLYSGSALYNNLLKVIKVSNGNKFKMEPS